MNKLNLAAALAVFSIVSVGVASEPSADQVRYSTVKLFFVTITLPDAALDSTKETAHAGNLILGTTAVRPAAIHIDSEFVGHAMFGHLDVKPTFNLPSGMHKFRIECEGFQTFESGLKVLGAGSEQWLVVIMRPESEKPVAATNTEPKFDEP